mgnify:CR=1 FL=1
MKAKFDFGLTKANWPTPKLYGVGNFTEFGLYQVALTIAKINGYINQEVLMSEIPQRIKGLIVVDSKSHYSYCRLGVLLILVFMKLCQRQSLQFSFLGNLI